MPFYFANKNDLTKYAYLKSATAVSEPFYATSQFRASVIFVLLIAGNVEVQVWVDSNDIITIPNLMKICLGVLEWANRQRGRHSLPYMPTFSANLARKA